jgi:hypothetical protein
VTAFGHDFLPEYPKSIRFLNIQPSRYAPGASRRSPEYLACKWRPAGTIRSYDLLMPIEAGYASLIASLPDLSDNAMSLVRACPKNHDGRTGPAIVTITYLLM